MNITPRSIAQSIPADLLRLTARRLEKDIRRKFGVGSVTAQRAVFIARERAEKQQRAA